jgi:hypothetical protein
VLDLSIEGVAGPIGVTPNDPIWSDDRREFVRASDLVKDESLLDAQGARVAVREVVARSTRAEVFNLEVDGEHVNHVSSAGVLVHNNSSGIFVPSKGPYRGGSHADMSGPKTRGDGLDSHHMPDRYANPTVDPKDGPAIQMHPWDRHATSSNSWQGVESIRYRAETAQMIRKGRYRDAMAREIRDVRRAAREASSDPRKYNEAIQEMLEYARKKAAS